LGCYFYGHNLHNHPISLLAAAPIYLQNREKLNNVKTNFTVSNGWAYPPPPPPNSNPYNFPFQWGWFNPVYTPFSANGFIEIVPFNNANILMPSGGQDSLEVRLYNYFYPPYSNYNIVFEKIVPINVGP